MKKIIFLLLLLIPALYAVSQNVDNVDFRQDGGDVVVTYELKQFSDIELYVSTDGGKTFGKPLKKLSGDVGKAVNPGKREIVWDVLEEVGELQGDEIAFRVKAYPVNDFFVLLNYEYTATPNSAIGITIGNVKRWGWFAGFATGFDTDYFVKTGLVSSGDSFAYPFNGEKATKRLSVTAGVVYKLNNSIKFNAGAGYGLNELYWQTTAGELVLMDDYSAKGLELTAGMQYNIKKLAVSLNAVCTNFEILSLKVGLGLNISKGKKK